MVGLVTMLQRRTHRDLELIARAHNLPFTRREPKAQGLARLQRTLAGSAFEQAYRGLTSTHIDALQALVTAGGALPLRQFKRHFGKIRFYRPWRFDDGPRHPWRRPLSPAERLYHLGYILLREDGHVEIVDEVQALLPVLARPASVPTGIDAPAGRSALPSPEPAFAVGQAVAVSQAVRAALGAWSRPASGRRMRRTSRG